MRHTLTLLTKWTHDLQRAQVGENTIGISRTIKVAKRKENDTGVIKKGTTVRINAALPRIPPVGFVRN